MPPAELLRRLIQFDTTNPPGAEAACQQFLLDQFFPANTGRMTYGDASKLVMQELQLMAIMVFVPGLILDSLIPWPCSSPLSMN